MLTVEPWNCSTFSLFSRVKLVVDRTQPRLQNVRINLRRRQIRVPEHHLDGAQIGAALEQVRGEGVPQDVRTESARDACLHAVRLEDLPEADPRQAAAALRVDE